MTSRTEENETKIDFVLVRKEHLQFFQNENSIIRKLQHVLVVADIDNKKIKNVLIKTHIERRKISLLKEKIRRRFDEKLLN